jgi:WD40 repeat protein
MLATDGGSGVWPSARTERLACGGEDGVVRLRTGHLGMVLTVAVNPDGATLASGGEDFTVRLWGLATGTQGRLLTGHTGGVRQVAFSPDGKRLASAGEDGRSGSGARPVVRYSTRSKGTPGRCSASPSTRTVACWPRRVTTAP